MGSTTSKPAASVVLRGDTPVRFSGNLVDTLVSTSETDSSREKQLELHIQTRVMDELARLEARESEILASVDQQLAREKGGEMEATRLDREKVRVEIEALRKRLAEMPRVGELEEGMGRARGEVVKCLVANETRPLDCWKEVEEFKRQTRRMEKAFVVRTVGREY